MWSWLPVRVTGQVAHMHKHMHKTLRHAQAHAQTNINEPDEHSNEQLPRVRADDRLERALY